MWLLSRWLGSGGSRLGTGHRARAAAPESEHRVPATCPAGWQEVHHGRTGQQPNSGSGRDFVKLDFSAGFCDQLVVCSDDGGCGGGLGWVAFSCL